MWAPFQEWISTSANLCTSGSSSIPGSLSAQGWVFQAWHHCKWCQMKLHMGRWITQDSADSWHEHSLCAFCIYGFKAAFSTDSASSCSHMQGIFCLGYIFTRGKDRNPTAPWRNCFPSGLHPSLTLCANTAPKIPFFFPGECILFILWHEGIVAHP